jgi:phosphoserine phosphatase RsbU/P
MNTDLAPVFSTLDLLQMLFGVLFASAGAVSLLFFLGRRKRKEYPLLYFGLGALLYGIRLFFDGSAGYEHHRWEWVHLVISLVIPIPMLLFFIETVAGRWRKLALGVIGLFSVIAVLNVTNLLLRHDIKTAQIATNVSVIIIIPVLLLMLAVPLRSSSRDHTVLRAGFFVFLLFAIYTNLAAMGVIRGYPSLEFIGFGFFLACLGYVAAARTQRNEEQLLALNKELEIARGIQARLLPEKGLSIHGLAAASVYVPASSVAGDFYDFLPKDGGLGVLIADVSGHGVPAALSASMVKVAGRAQKDWAENPDHVLSGMNSILCGNLEGQFVTAGYLFLDPGRGAMAYAGAGHPPLLVWRSRGKTVEALEENGLVLGIFAEGAYQTLRSSVEPGDRFILYTDGVLEAPSPSGEEFGLERLKGFTEQYSMRPPQEFCDSLVTRLKAWCGNTGPAHDDLTVVVVDCKAA